jgi:hypothetical protein
VFFVTVLLVCLSVRVSKTSSVVLHGMVFFFSGGVSFKWRVLICVVWGKEKAFRGRHHFGGLCACMWSDMMGWGFPVPWGNGESCLGLCTIG